MEQEKPKFPSITPETMADKEALIKFIPLAEMAARQEMKSLPPYTADFKELVNIGLIKINQMIKEASDKNKTFNPSFIVQGISWEIRNKNRHEAHQRGEFKSSGYKQKMDSEGFSLAEVREAVIETVVSFEENSFDFADENSIDPAQALEIQELKLALKQSIALLPDNYRQVIELRFYRGMKGVDIADRLGISSTRVTRIIQDSIDLIRDKLSEKKLM